MGYSCAQAMGWSASLITINLAVDFIGNAEIGRWLAVESEVIKTGSTICFAESLIKADDAVIARANGTFRVVKKEGVMWLIWSHQLQPSCPALCRHPRIYDRATRKTWMAGTSLAMTTSRPCSHCLKSVRRNASRSPRSRDR